MKETKFIEQNKKKWAEFEDLSRSKHKDSNLYSKLYIQITDDLSYARTFYSNRSVRVYLNNLAQDIFHKIFSRNRKKQSVLKDFWMEDLPSIMYHHRLELLISFLVLIVSIAIGLLTYQNDPAFATKILGDGYVQMTAENIAKKDPMAVYKQSGPIEMFIRIVLNNLMVDIRTFFSGLIFSIGSVLVLLYNGLMLSAFQFYFIKRGLFWDSFLAVWLHGTLEISAMVICGAAGIVLGKGIVFPGTFSRTQAFFSSAQRATKIFFSVLPITFAAGIIESFLTRYTQAPDILRLALILISLFFILGYYVYLPWLKKRNGTLRILEAEKVLPEYFAPFEFYQIKKVSEIILDSFSIFRKYASFFFSTIFRSVIIITIIGLTINKDYLLEDIYYTQWSLANLDYYFIANSGNWFSILMPVLLFYISLQVNYVFYKEITEQTNQTVLSFFEWQKENWKKLISAFIVQILFYSILSYLT
ncbi:MAG TPA: stage II sporulation protein M, partial [Chitinophagales bacterium]|nr:stage II sporulation protein M [Chitinophagales bacterium]